MMFVFFHLKIPDTGDILHLILNTFKALLLVYYFKDNFSKCILKIKLPFMYILC